MDYFSKFRKRIVTPKAQPTGAMQLAKFHKCWNYVHNIYAADDRKPNLHVQQTEIPSRLRQMVDLLVDEEARQEDSSTGVCMEYFLKNGILHFLVNVSEKADYPVGMRSETIRTVASMIDLLDDRFLVQHAVHKPTIRLLRFCVLDEQQSDQYDEDLVDLMYIICSKIHGFPALLNIFFHDRQWLTTPQKTQHLTTPDQTQPTENPLQVNHQRNSQGEKKPDYEFVLFTYLLRFVHREGRSGDFARTGLLFLMEMATGQLGDFILESDFATIMAAGLGALYSQLPRKLVVQEEADIPNNSTTFLLASDQDSLRMPFGIDIETSNSSDFRSRLDSFLKLLEFCQDILTRCPSVEICVSLLQNIRSIFLDNILYPSILECSDTDGSAVAVISYIDMILQTLQQDELVDVVVGFLMAVDDSTEDLKVGSPQVEKGSLLPDGKQTSDIYVGIEGDKVKSSPYFTALGRFTLKDLIFSRLKSSSQPTVIATLKLLKTLISNHCRYSLRLLSIQLDDTATSFPHALRFTEQVGRVEDAESNAYKASMTTISHHNREIELFFSLICTIDYKHSQDILSLGYESYLSDAEATILNDCCYQNAANMDLDVAGSNHQRQSKLEKRRSLKYGQKYDERIARSRESSSGKLPAKYTHQHLYTMPKHRLKQTDPLLQILLGLLSHFHAQSSELNLALTAVISALAVCPFRSLEGWLAFNEEDRARDVLVLGPDQTSAERQSSKPGNKIRVNDIYAQFDKDPTPVNEDDEDDDRSIDFATDRNSVNMTAATNFRSFPPIFTLLRTLTQQVDYYRSEISQFDTYLEERRQGLFFGDAFSNVSETASTSNDNTKQSEVANSPPSTMSLFWGVGAGNKRQAAKSKVAANTQSSSQSAVGKSSTNKHPASSVSYSSNATGQNAEISEALVAHARKMADVRIQPLFPSNFVVEPRETILDLNDDDEDTFAPKGRNPSQPKRQDKTTEIKLSTLLNNVVILEECIKELVALVQVRRSMGIDEILYT
ncbi:Retinoic acid induced 16-like protein-domain-containing protein [Umbelopsis sp. PMI_123]|nr:Retinoic acid induced 16-like protein-domain-containing protein [Umbelopsis sp. PMI_123]